VIEDTPTSSATCSHTPPLERARLQTISIDLDVDARSAPRSCRPRPRRSGFDSIDRDPSAVAAHRAGLEIEAQAWSGQ